MRNALHGAGLLAALALALTGCNDGGGATPSGAPSSGSAKAPSNSGGGGAAVDLTDQIGAAKDAVREQVGEATGELTQGLGDTLGDAADASVPPLAEKDVLAALPKGVGDFKRTDFKVKRNVKNFTEFSATFVADGQELKVVLNDFVNREGSAYQPRLWGDAIRASGVEIGGHPALSETRKDKHTVMIQLSDRLRLDVKSRDIAADALEKLARGIDLAALAVLAQQVGN